LVINLKHHKHKTKMKHILTLLLFVAINCKAQRDTLIFTSTTFDCYRTYVSKTNGLGSPALYISCDGKMTVNDSLESIKQLLYMYDKQQDEILELYKKLSVASDYIYSTKGLIIPNDKIHSFFRSRNKYHKAMGQYSELAPCQCDKCLLKNPKNYRKEFHNN